MCVCGVARDTKKSPHVRTATNESEEELVLGEYFSRSPSHPKPLNSYNTKKFFSKTKTQQTPTRDDDARRRARLRRLAHTQHLRETKNVTTAAPILAFLGVFLRVFRDKDEGNNPVVVDENKITITNNHFRRSLRRTNKRNNTSPRTSRAAGASTARLPEGFPRGISTRSGVKKGGNRNSSRARERMTRKNNNNRRWKISWTRRNWKSTRKGR